MAKFNCPSEKKQNLVLKLAVLACRPLPSNSTAESRTNHYQAQAMWCWATMARYKSAVGFAARGLAFVAIIGAGSAASRILAHDLHKSKGDILCRPNAQVTPVAQQDMSASRSLSANVHTNQC